MSDLEAFFQCLRDARAPLPKASADELARRLLQQNALERIAQSLTKSRLDALLFKGAALLQKVYPAQASRPMSDIDMLARPGQNALLVQALKEGGAKYQEPKERPKSAALLGESGFLVPQGNLGSFVEVHAHIGKAVPRPIEIDALFARSRPLRQHPSLLIPSPEDHALLIAIDASQNEFRYPRALLDIEMLFRQGLDFGLLVERARRFQAQTALFEALQTLYFLGAASISKAHLEALRPSWIQRALLSFLFQAPQPKQFPRARGPYRLGLVWMLRQGLLRDDKGAYILGVLRYGAARLGESVQGNSRL